MACGDGLLDKSLLCKPEDLSSDPQRSYEETPVVVHTCNLNMGETEGSLGLLESQANGT